MIVIPKNNESNYKPSANRYKVLTNALSLGSVDISKFEMKFLLLLRTPCACRRVCKKSL